MKKISKTIFLCLLLTSVVFSIEQDIKTHTAYDETFLNIQQYYIENYASVGVWPGDGTLLSMGDQDWSGIVQSALNELDPISGGTIYFPVGVYNLENTLYLSKYNVEDPGTPIIIRNLTIKGAGAGKLQTRTANFDLGTTFKRKGDGAIISINIKPDNRVSSFYPAVIEDILFRSDNGNVTGIIGYRVGSTVIRDCNFYGLNEGINFMNHVSAAGDSKNGKDNYTDGLLLENLNFDEMIGTGIKISGGDYTKISKILYTYNNSINSSNEVSGMQFFSCRGMSIDNVLVNNIQNGTCILFDYSTGCEVSGMHFEGNRDKILAAKNSNNISFNNSFSMGDYSCLLNIENSKNIELFNHESEKRPLDGGSDLHLIGGNSVTKGISLRNVVLWDDHDNNDLTRSLIRTGNNNPSVATFAQDSYNNGVVTNDFIKLTHDCQTNFGVSKAGTVSARSLNVLKGNNDSDPMNKEHAVFSVNGDGAVLANSFSGDGAEITNLDWNKISNKPGNSSLSIEYAIISYVNGGWTSSNPLVTVELNSVDKSRLYLRGIAQNPYSLMIQRTRFTTKDVRWHRGDPTDLMCFSSMTDTSRDQWTSVPNGFQFGVLIFY